MTGDGTRDSGLPARALTKGTAAGALELAKVLATALNPAAGGAFAIAKESIKAYWQEKRTGQLEKYLKFVQDSLARHEKALARLDAARKVPDEPLVDVFIHNLEAAYNDDELAKARYYAAFTVGLMNRWDDFSPEKRLVFFDALKRMKLQDLKVLAVVVRVANPNLVHQVDDALLSKALHVGEIESHRKRLNLESFDVYLVAHSLSVLGGLGLMLEETRDTSSSVIGNMGGMAQDALYYCTRTGSELMVLILEHLISESPRPT